MKIPWTKIARVLAEVLIDAVTGKLERKTEPAVPVRPRPHADAARQSAYARMAGPQCSASLPTGERCRLYAGHAGRHRFSEPVPSPGHRP